MTPARYTQPLDLLLESQFRRTGVELPEHFFRAYQAELYDMEADPVEAMSVVVAQQTVLEQLQVRLWTTILDQQLRRRQLGVMYEPGLQELDEDTLRELRTLGYIR